MEILGQCFEAVLRVGMASDRGEVTAFHEIGSGGRGDLAEATTERHEFVEALRRAGVQGGARLQQGCVAAEFGDGFAEFAERGVGGKVLQSVVDLDGELAGLRETALGDGEQGGLPGEAQGVVGARIGEQGAQPVQGLLRFGGAAGFAGVLDEAPGGGPEGLARARAARAGGFFDGEGHAIPGGGVVARLEQAEHALVEGVFGQPDVGGFLLQSGVGFLGEREVLGEEEAVGGRDAQAGALRFDARVGEGGEVGRGQPEGTVAPGGDGQRARRLAGERAGRHVFEEILGGLPGLLTAAGEEHQLGAGEVDRVEHLRVARTVVGERARILAEEEIVHLIGHRTGVDRLAGLGFGPRVGGGDERTQGGEPYGDVGRIARGFLEAFTAGDVVGAEDQSGEEVGLGLAGGRQPAGRGEGLRRALGVLALGMGEREIAGVGVGERGAAGFVGELAQGFERAVLDLAGEDRGAVAEEFDALTLFFGDRRAGDGLLAERRVEVVALGRGDHPAQGVAPGRLVGR